MDNKQKHLEMIQNIICRMSSNLFYLKGWTITLVSALFALNIKEKGLYYVWLSYFPVLIFWILDGYFLSQERLFRMLYNKVRKLKNDKIDFSMDTSEFRKFCDTSWHKSVISITLLIFYLPLLFTMIIYSVFLIQKP